MASRRRLKKTIQFASGELMEDVLFKTLLAKKDITEKTDKILVDIAHLNGEFTKRAGKPDAKENPVLVKKYYKKLYEDWNKEIEKIIKEIEKA
ncbi:conserved hypothetical protein [uncultured Paludibacter sp.]|nr:conserved hypothetical protein [uncultured Paludibacter sp.]